MIKNKIPCVLLDKHGYPTKEWIEFIINFKPTKKAAILDFVKVLENGWYMADWGYKLHRKYRGKRKLELHTGGWSGNEEVIDAILSNPYLRHFYMQYVMWRTGGHYYFNIVC